MMRLIASFIILNTCLLGFGQTAHILPKPAESMSDAPQGYVTYMYEEFNTYSEGKDINWDNVKLLNAAINRDFNHTTKPYIVVFSNAYTKDMVEQQTEKLLKKWDFENNYPYSYVLILSNFSPRIIFGKYLSNKDAEAKAMCLTIESLWKSNAAGYTKLSEIIARLKNLITYKDIPYSEDYLAQWDKRHFFNYSKTVSEKQERYLNKLLDETYHKENLRFWILSGTTSKNKEVLAELLQKADFDTHSNQVIITVNTDIFGISIIVTKDLQGKWSTAAENQVKQTAEFYYDRGWYYDLFKEIFLMTREELLYKNTLIRQQEEQSRIADAITQKKIHSNTIRVHKMLFWVIAVVLIIPLLRLKKYIENTFSGQPLKKLNDMKLFVGIGYAVILFVTGAWITYYTPFFYTKKALLITVSNTFLWMIIYFLVVFVSYSKGFLRNDRSAKILLISTGIIYFFSVPANYFFSTSEEWITENISAGRDLLNIIIVMILGSFMINLVARKRRFDTLINSINSNSASSYLAGESLRKGFGKKEYVSKYIGK